MSWHKFSEKKEGLSIEWLDENFQILLDKTIELNTTIETQAGRIKELDDKLFAANDAIRKLGSTETIANRVLATLREKPAKAKK